MVLLTCVFHQFSNFNCFHELTNSLKTLRHLSVIHSHCKIHVNYRGGQSTETLHTLQFKALWTYTASTTQNKHK